MRLLDVIQGKLIIPQMRARTKWEAIEELVDRLVEEHEIRIFDRPEVVEAVRLREESLSTGINDQLAIPHARTRAVDDLIGTLGIAPGGIPFDSADGKPARLLCLVLIPSEQYSDHIQTLARISRLLIDPDVREALIRAGRSGSVEAVVQVVESREGPDYLNG